MIARRLLLIASLTGGCVDRIDHGTSMLGSGDAQLPNLVGNGTFEETLSPWYGHNSSLARVDTAHGGAYGCKVCRVTDTCYSVIHAWVDNPRAGEVFEARAWIRAAPGMPAPDVSINLREANAGNVYGTKSNSGGVLPTETWELIVTEHTMSADFDKLELYVSGCGSLTGDCFVVDDIELGRQP